ncbi:MAG: hypothetical protein U9M90_03575, partial [Patescibacteria group bacterium]|nr:hypothetical protein [Patescibacteria group bacterium]
TAVGSYYGLRGDVDSTGIFATAAQTSYIYGIYGDAAASGVSTAGTVNTYGGYFTAAGESTGAATTNAYGIYVNGATGADSNYSAVFMNGNVGVGTASPGGKLHILSASSGGGANSAADELIVEGSGASGITISSGTSSHGSLRFGDGGATGSGILLYDHTNDSMDFFTAGTEKVTIDSSGKVGIGTTSPGELLHIRKDGNTYAKIHAITGSGQSAGIKIQRGGWDSDNYADWEMISAAGDLKFNLYADTDFSDVLVLNSNGKVGIGTNGPDRLLHAEVSDAVTNAVTYAQRLSHITSGIAAAGFGTGIEFELESGSGNNEIISAIQSILTDATDDAEHGELAFLTADIGDDGLAERMRIDKDGNVGIGTASPDSQLSVVGNISIGDLAAGTSGTRVLVMENGTIPGTSPANAIQLYSEDVTSSSELKVRDEAGNITTLSPHNFSLIPNGPSENLAWSFYSERDKLAINIDMAKAVRIIEQISGQKLIYLKDLVGNRYIEETPEMQPLLSLENNEEEIIPDDVIIEPIGDIQTLEELGSITNDNFTVIGAKLENIDSVIEKLGTGETESRLEQVISVMNSEIDQIKGQVVRINERLDTFATSDDLTQLTMTTDNLYDMTLNLSSQVALQSQQIEELTKKVASLGGNGNGDNESAMEELLFHSFEGESEEVSSNLANTTIEEGSFNGLYNGQGEYQGIRIDKTDGEDLSGYEVAGGYIIYNIFIEDADIITDFHTEFGNEIDADEVEWDKERHPFFIDGWNEVRLAIAEGYEAGEIDREDITHFRVFFSFSGETNIKLGAIACEMRQLPEAPATFALDDLNIDEEIDLLTDEGQRQEIIILANAHQDLSAAVARQFAADELRLSRVEETIESLNAFDNFATDQLAQHEYRISMLEQSVGLGAMADNDYFQIDESGNIAFKERVKAPEVETDVIVAGEYTIKNDEEAKNTGSATVLEGQQEIFVDNDKVRDTSRIIVTPIGNSPISWIVSEKDDGKGFMIRLSDPAEFDIVFDYWIVQTE